MRDIKEKRKSDIAVVVRTLLLIIGVSVFNSGQTKPSQSRVVEVQVHSVGLAQNLLGDSVDQTVAIYLPAAYETESQRRFATIYLLHGYADTPAPGVATALRSRRAGSSCGGLCGPDLAC